MAVQGYHQLLFGGDFDGLVESDQDALADALDGGGHAHRAELHAHLVAAVVFKGQGGHRQASVADVDLSG